MPLVFFPGARAGTAHTGPHKLEEASDSFGETQQRRKDFLPALLASLGVSTEVEARLSLLISCLEHCTSTSRLAQRIGLRKNL